MEGNTKKAPILDRLVDTPTTTTPVQPSTAQLTQNQTTQPNATSKNQATKPTLTPTNGKTSTNKENSTKLETLNTPKNRRTDKSQFELELTQIVNRILHQHISQASEQIVQQVLREVRARLPGQKKR